MSIKTKTIIVSRVIMNFLMLVGSWIVGDFIGAIISYWSQPWLQYSHSMFISELFSLGSLLSSLFVLLVYAPTMAVLFLLTKYFAVWNLLKNLRGYFWVLPLVLASIVRQHLFGAIEMFFLEYICNAVLAGIIFLAVVVSFNAIKTKFGRHNME